MMLMLFAGAVLFVACIYRLVAKHDRLMEDTATDEAWESGPLMLRRHLEAEEQFRNGARGRRPPQKDAAGTGV